MALTSKLAQGIAMPLIVFATGVGLSIGLGVVVDKEIERSAHQRFDADATELARKVEGRFDDYTEVLIGLRALFNTSETMTREQFAEYVEGLAPSTSFPGFRCLNYAPHLATADRADAHPLAFIEPMRGNESVAGRDLAAVPAALKALQQAGRGDQR